jgi:hypothetical protein
VIATGPKVRRVKPGRQRWILYAIKICSTTSFGVEVKPAVPCRKILRHVNDPSTYDRATDTQIQWPFLTQFLPVSLVGVSAATKAEKSGR